MDREVKIAALSLIALLAVIGLLQPVISAKYPGFTDLAILGPNQSFSGYPKEVNVSQPILLYGYIENHEGAAEYYQFVVKLGNESTPVGNSTAANAPVVLTYSVVLLNNQSSLFPLSLSINKAGINQRFIFELWTYDLEQSAFEYTGVYNEIWMNVTATSK